MMMDLDRDIVVKTAKFLYSKTRFEASTLKEVVMVGRSNVGKSSLINMLVNVKGLARSSSTPGRTRLINYFEVVLKQEECIRAVRLVDLPGYGYARASKQARSDWDAMIDDYLLHANVGLCICLVDSRHPPQESDIVASRYLYSMQKPFVVVASKSDKLSRAQVVNARTAIAIGLKIGRDDIVMSSATKGLGRQDILQKLWTSVE